MDPWFTLFTLWFFFLTLGFISIDLPFSFAWNTAFMSGLGLLIAAWWVDKLKKHACRAVGPALAACFEPLIHYWNATSLSLFYSYFFGNYSFELAEIANASWRSTQYYYKFFFFLVVIFRCCEDVFGSTFFHFKTRLWTSLPDECFSLSDDLNDFKSRVNRHLSS